MEPSTPPAEKRSLFDTIITSTPVLLTVIATFILGQSSGEMTKAQYQRALASQNQSKVGDQWAFFQAKRIRGTTYEATAIALFAHNAGPFTRATLFDAGEMLQREIQAAHKDLDGDKLAAHLADLDKKVAFARERAKAALEPGKEGWRGKRITLTRENVQDALAALDTYLDGKIEEAEDKVDAEQRKLLDGIVEDVRKFKPEKEIAPKTLAIKPETIDLALERAKAKANKVSERGKAIDRVLEEIDALVDQQTALSRDYQRIISQYIATIRADNPQAEKLEKRMDRVRATSARLVADYKAARYTFDARRYEDDARSNQEEAYIYDVRVLQASAMSDRHLKRSFGFMIAMLIAQVGVTIGSVAIALKWKVPMWLVATFAGISAIIFGVYVYLELGPLL